MTEWITAACIVIGVFFIFVAGLGIIRLTDFYSRLHAPTKAATLGLIFLLIGVIVHLGEPVVVTKAVLALLFIGATAPVAAHILGRAAYRTKVPASPDTYPDEYAPVVARRRTAEKEKEPDQAVDLEGDEPEGGRKPG